ncbi:MAG: 2,3-bisphosphoglycerate-independent phosphoglycerate mutase [Candidatus Curtissbacteria bacterium]|nr:2,3-bisphosphoglycerate-independent phosphoglycerate mutase [Candidatus Curtissbacteria bacterium]
MIRLSRKPKPLILCILDGWATAEDSPGNAVIKANPVNFNGLWFSYPHTFLETGGQAVGLPAGEVGNSEVGHQNLGAGKIVFQDLLKINHAIANGDFENNEALLGAIGHANKNNSKIHVMGLVGYGSVHSDVDHLFAILTFLKKSAIDSKRIKIHLFTDGRDSPPSSAKNYVTQIQNKITQESLGEISSIIGRYFAMDRDNHWERTQKAYDCLTGKSQNKSTDPIQLIEDSYLKGITDEFIEPITIERSGEEQSGFIEKGDSIIFFNYRPDRARQLTKSFVLDKFDTVTTTSKEQIKTFDRGSKIPNLYFATMTKYEDGLPVSAIAFEKETVVMPLARVFAERGLRQFHIAETEKYAHVTYFFNGGREPPYAGEDRLLVNSPRVASYDQKPEMAAIELTNEVVKRIESRVYDLIVINFANPDMVAHTGNLEAAIRAVQTVDKCLATLANASFSAGGGIIITSDHGNAEQLINPKTGAIDTEHNENPTPCIFALPELKGNTTQLKQGILADIAPTILTILNIPKPPQMTGRNLLQ